MRKSKTLYYFYEKRILNYLRKKYLDIINVQNIELISHFFFDIESPLLIIRPYLNVKMLPNLKNENSLILITTKFTYKNRLQ